MPAPMPAPATATSRRNDRSRVASTTSVPRCLPANGGFTVSRARDGRRQGDWHATRCHQVAVEVPAADQRDASPARHHQPRTRNRDRRDGTERARAGRQHCRSGWVSNALLTHRDGAAAAVPFTGRSSDSVAGRSGISRRRRCCRRCEPRHEVTRRRCARDGLLTGIRQQRRCQQRRIREGRCGARGGPSCPSAAPPSRAHQHQQLQPRSRCGSATRP